MKETMPYIPQREILHLAIQQVDVQIHDWESKKEAIPENSSTQEMINEIIKPLAVKREMLERLYEMETGTEY